MIGLNANVRIEYKGFLEDGTVFDSSELNGPAEFVTGSGQIIEGLDAAIQGMDVGETAMFHIPAKAAYGSTASSISRNAICATCRMRINFLSGKPFHSMDLRGRRFPPRC